MDLECLEALVQDLKVTEKDPQIANQLYVKIQEALEFINLH
jgi:hypothetical protein